MGLSKFFRKKALYKAVRGNVSVHAPHKILDQLGRQILEGLAVDDFIDAGDVLIFVGCHHDFGLSAQRDSLRIGIQTEQFFDQSGAELWGMLRKPKAVAGLLRNLACVDVMLDINVANSAWWDAQDLSDGNRTKLHFGPKIFPSEPRQFQGKKNGPNLFFGDLSGRRGTILRQLEPGKVKILPTGTYGADLMRELDNAAAVVNIHFEHGVYTEAPRLLSAYLAGKPVISEMLDRPFIEGKHYLALRGHDHENLEDVYNSFSSLVTSDLSFGSFLKSVLGTFE